ncbi:hypothetical protein ISF_02838 [Cordyceps fumosorosea ARSEF 2679]|uniref:Uncharacterized protein n=1 Tax=Cordyceps fumosorosea (strain ARSEF 2679) TaxID=1081104 RepID=A0A168B3F7_CORFA|nr:hypothetical protein ISF_02838 [Cordyceps fumosorosea ARSEF 2679]OAA69568.1 hypothetical protein ISF_02838 [Cordyceps fumosorosea ARSEF 2679]
MDVSYDEIPLTVQVPVRVFSARCNSIMAVIFFDLFGKPAQITIPAERQLQLGAGYEVLREVLHALARSLEPKGGYYAAPRYIPVASQIEEMLRDFMLDAALLPAAAAGPAAVDWLGQLPLEWFLAVGRQQFLLTEDAHGRVAAGAAQAFTFVCMRELGARAASEGCHRAMAFQIQQLERISQACHGMGNEARQRRDMCVPDLRAVLYHDLTAATNTTTTTTGLGIGRLLPERLPVGVLFDELPQILPLRAAAAPPDVFKECVLKICKTVEWLVDVGIGWGGSVGADHKGYALLDAIFLDALYRPWLIEGFTEAKEGKVLSDRISVHMLRVEFGLLGV